MEAITLQCKDKICQAYPALAPMMEVWYATFIMAQRANQAVFAHDDTYPEVKKASEDAWQLWPKIGRKAPEGWQPKVMTKYLNKESLLCQEWKEAVIASNDTFQTLSQSLAEMSETSLALGKGQFGHSGKPRSKPTKPSRIELREADRLAKQPIRAKSKTAKPAASKLSLFWNPMTKSYQRSSQIQNHAKSHGPNQKYVTSTTINAAQSGDDNKAELPFKLKKVDKVFQIK